MPRGAASLGQCAYCKKDFDDKTMPKHLLACAERLTLIAKAEKKKAGKPETLYHLRVQDAYNKTFWLDLEMAGSATLEALDDYLRAIWLECCGHMSHFAFGGWQGEELAMRTKISAVLRPKAVLTHLYDYGTTSETLVQALSAREGKPTTRHPIALMARNLPAKELCLVCKKPAQFFCIECVIEDETEGTLCEAHAKVHEHDNYDDPIPLVNSPRLGMCGYSGPADPPY